MALLLSTFSCSKKAQPRKQPPVVLITKVEQRTVPIEIKNFGTVEAYSTIAVKSQVTGILTDVNFTEGTMVKKNDVILTIDPRPFEAVLKAVQANLNKDEVQLKLAQTELKRQEELLKKGFASQEQYDQAVTLANTYQASIEAGKAAVESAKLQLEYCYIKSPVDGIAGTLEVDKGNLVKQNDITIITINQIKPIYVSFTVPQEYLQRIRKYMSQGPLEVTTSMNQSGEMSNGVLTFIDNSIDNNTGTVRLRATFENNDANLWPGQFVNVSLILAQEPNVIVVPSQAVQTSQTGQHVFIVKADTTVEMRNVKVVRRLDGDSAVEGLEAGETVVTDGQINLLPGVQVQIKNTEQK